MTNTATLADLIDQTGVDVHDHLDRDALVPTSSGLQIQGDVAVIPHRKGRSANPAIAVPATGIPVIRGENGGHTHLLLAEGPVTWTATTTRAQDIGILDVPKDATAWLAHPEHGYVGIAPGSYVLRRQREQADEIRMVAD
jgi:hypothetical protein